MNIFWIHLFLLKSWIVVHRNHSAPLKPACYSKFKWINIIVYRLQYTAGLDLTPHGTVVNTWSEQVGQKGEKASGIPWLPTQYIYWWRKRNRSKPINSVHQTLGGEIWSLSMDHLGAVLRRIKRSAYQLPIIRVLSQYIAILMIIEKGFLAACQFPLCCILASSHLMFWTMLGGLDEWCEPSSQNRTGVHSYFYATVIAV